MTSVAERLISLWDGIKMGETKTNSLSIWGGRNSRKKGFERFGIERQNLMAGENIDKVRNRKMGRVTPLHLWLLGTSNCIYGSVWSTWYQSALGDLVGQSVPLCGHTQPTCTTKSRAPRHQNREGGIPTTGAWDTTPPPAPELHEPLRRVGRQGTLQQLHADRS